MSYLASECHRGVRLPSSKEISSLGNSGVTRFSFRALSCPGRPIKCVLGRSHVSKLNWKIFSKVSNEGEPLDTDLLGDEEDKVMMEHLKAFIHGRDDVNRVLKRMTDILEELIDQGVKDEEAILISSAKSVEEHMEGLDRSFLLALDVEIKNAEDDAEKRKVLESVKEQVLFQLTASFPPQVRVVSILSTTTSKVQRKEILCQAIAGGGVFKTVDGGRLEVPGTDLQSVLGQVNDLVETIEEKDVVADRKLLARLVLVREEARTLLSGGAMDDRNDPRKFRNVPATHVDFMSKLMSLKGKALTDRLMLVFNGKDEGSDKLGSGDESAGAEGRISDETTGLGKDEGGKRRKKLPVRPGGFLDSLTRITKEIYKGDRASGIEQLQWIRKQSLQVLQDISHPKLN